MGLQETFQLVEGFRWSGLGNACYQAGYLYQDTGVR
jgi:hypothetical protein